MVKINDLTSILDDDLLDIIYEERCEKLSTITIMDRKIINSLLENRKKAYEDINIAINNIPNAFVGTKKMIKDSVEDYLEIINLIGSYESEKFYKCGFGDGINIKLNKNRIFYKIVEKSGNIW